MYGSGCAVCKELREANVSVRPEGKCQYYDVEPPHECNYRISGNFRVIKCSRGKNSRSKIFALRAFRENLTRGKETSAFVATPRWQTYLPISARTVGLYFPYGARFPLDAVRMASSTSRFAAAISWDYIEEDNEPLGSGRPFLRCSHLNKAIFAISFLASI